MARTISLCRIGYVEEALKAERRLARGERQQRCPKCWLWWWPEEMKKHPCSSKPEER